MHVPKLSFAKENVEDDVIEEEEVPKLETIRNWMFHYTSQYHQESAIVVQA
ncbi:3487_t:CDS:2, partial [Rhizophagus irregularis]